MSPQDHDQQRRNANPWTASLLTLSFVALLTIGGHCDPGGSHNFRFLAPADGLLSSPGPVDLKLRIPPSAAPGTLEVLLDGLPLDPALLSEFDGVVTGVLPDLAPGPHQLEARTAVGRGRGLSDGRGRGDRRRSQRAMWHTSSAFTLVELENPEQCEILNAVSCVLPFPSSRFLETADTETGYQVVFGPETLPGFNRLVPGRDGSFPSPTDGPFDSSLFLQNDGFSPTVQILMHFPPVDPDPEDPDLLDPAGSGAPHIDPGTRIYDARGLDRDSPTLLIDYHSGERINHWLENDARAIKGSAFSPPMPQRVITFMRPTGSLTPGHRYIVAVRGLVDEGGRAFPAEAAFANIRDLAPSDIPAVNERRAQLEPVLRRLSRFGVRRSELILAFDFVVQSDHSLTHEMLAMRDDSFDWLADRAGEETFAVESIDEVNPGCAPEGNAIWRTVTGTFQVPLYLERDPYLENRTLSWMNRDASGQPLALGTTDAPFGIAIPCAVFDGPDDFRALPPVVVGHGLFGDGPGTVLGLAGALAEAEGTGFEYIAAGTNWAGLSLPDFQPCNFDFDDPDNFNVDCFLFKVVSNLDNIEALADRLRQGQLATLVLTRMLATGAFNQHEAFKTPNTPEGDGVILGDSDVFYFGISLGGVMGTMFAALTPDVERLNVDVPGINFSLLLQRANPFVIFQFLLDFLINTDSMDQAIGIGAIHELWVRGEPAGYVTHITENPLPGVPSPKRILLTAAMYDHQVANLASLTSATSMGLPHLEGSAQRDVAELPRVVGPQESGFIFYDTGGLDPSIPEHEPFIPPITNEFVEQSRCDPHGRQFGIPASLDQLLTFLTPDGLIENFCTDDGICNASEPNEISGGDETPCDPL